VVLSMATKSPVPPAPPWREKPPQPAEQNGRGAQANSASTKLRVDLAHLEALNYSISELLINQNRQDLQDEQVQGLVKELTERLRQHQQTMMYLREWSDRLLIAEVNPLKYQGTHAVPDFDALELDQHSEMHELLQDALEEIVKLSQTVEGLDLTVRQSGQILSKQSRLLMNARDDLMEVRMVPIGSVLNRLPRLLQQLVEAHGKQVELQLKGTQVLVDKVIADKLYDPLLHLIRNAFDHGIESTESRIQQGKSPIGKITIHVYQQGNRTLIDIQDDGYGLDLPKICQRAYEVGLLPSDQVDQFTKVDLINVLFEPGFSTAAQVSDLSGRGVGLDVVKAQVQALKGIVTVLSEPTQGTTFSLQLPLTLMTARLLVCQVGPTIYGFLSDEVERVLLPQTHQIESATGQAIFHWQQGAADCPVPVHPLANLITYGLTLPPIAQYELTAPVLNSHTHPLLLLQVTDGLIGIQVDQIVGEQELVIRPISTAITPPVYIYGCSILADGRLMLVIDGAALVKPPYGQDGHKTLTHRSRTAEAKLDLLPIHPPSVKRVLVVDDSITIRQTLAASLKGSGYEVLQAQDGLDAIAQLQQQPNIQLITCDVEMPRLNGFEFLMRYRQDAGLPQVPVVMLTSRTSEKHRQLALQLGATAYMTKPYINQEFISEIAHLMSAN
jgi:two-component system, chemotaxis family, sensor histidine kinase and response regulator PixL